MRSVRNAAAGAVAAALLIGLGAWPLAGQAQDESELKGSKGEFEGTLLKVFAPEHIAQFRVLKVDKDLIDRMKDLVSDATIKVGRTCYVRDGEVLGMEKGDLTKLRPGTRALTKFKGYREVVAPRSLRDAGGPENIYVWEADEVIVLEVPRSPEGR